MPDSTTLTFKRLTSDVNNDTCEECDPENDATFRQYEIANCREALYRVLWKNKVENPPRKSLVGDFGHIERMNVATHILASLLQLLHAMLRHTLPFVQSPSTSNDLATVASATLAACYFTSAVFHTYSPVQWWSAVLRPVDYAFVYLSIAAGLLADLSIVTDHLRDLPWQALVDSFGAASILIGFFVFRRSQLSENDTRTALFPELCALGLSRRSHLDLEHSSLRVAGGWTLTFAWVLHLTAAVQNLPSQSAAVFVATRVASALLLLSGVYFDNEVVFPEAFLRQGEQLESHRCLCSSKKYGCVVLSHTIWHIVAFAASTVCVVGREFVLCM